MSLKLHHVGHPLSNLCLCCLPNISYLFDEACAHRVHVYCYLFTESSSCRRSFFDWATPVKLCSSVFCMLIDCLLPQFLGLIQERVHVPHRMHVVNELKQQVVDVRFCLSAISLTTCRLDDTCKEGCTISWTSFTSSASTPRSFMIFSKSARETHTLPPAKLLRQNFTGLACDFRLRSAFDVISSDTLSSHVSFPLSAWNFARVFFSSIHSANTVGERSNFLTLALQLLSVDGTSRPFQSSKLKYSCIRNWVVRWSPCALSTRLRIFAHHSTLQTT